MASLNSSATVYLPEACSFHWKDIFFWCRLVECTKQPVNTSRDSDQMLETFVKSVRELLSHCPPTIHNHEWLA